MTFSVDMTLHKVDFNVTQGKKGIPRVTSILMSANKNIFSKKQNFSSLSSIKKEAITMLKLSNLDPSII